MCRCLLCGTREILSITEESAAGGKRKHKFQGLSRQEVGQGNSSEEAGEQSWVGLPVAEFAERRALISKNASKDPGVRTQSLT
jgi:hypothetical protein